MAAPSLSTSIPSNHGSEDRLSYVDPRGSPAPYHRALPDIPDEVYYQFLTTKETHEDWQCHTQNPMESQRGLYKFMQDNQELLDLEDSSEPIVKEPLRTVFCYEFFSSYTHAEHVFTYSFSFMIDICSLQGKHAFFLMLTSFFYIIFYMCLPQG